MAKAHQFTSNGVLVSYLEDFSGSIRFSSVSKTLAENMLSHSVTTVGGETTLEVRVPFEVLKEIVVEYVRNERIVALEDAGADDILMGWV